MSVIQNIRNKYIGFVVGAIIIALIGFLVMDAMQSNVRNIFGKDQTLLAKVNGNRVDYKDFESLRSKYEDNMKARSKESTLDDQQRTQIQEQVWNDILNENLINGEMQKLGIEFTDKELQDMETSPYADPLIQQNFRDPNTGIFDPNKVSQYITSLGQGKKEEQEQKRAQWRDFENQLIKARRMAKYTDLITKGIYVPKFVMQNMQKDAAGKSAISYVSVPYTSINDADVKVSDDDIKNYMNKNADLMKSQEATAKINYVVFDIIPSKEDTAASLGAIIALQNEFTNTPEMDAFISKNSEESYSEMYVNEKTLAMPNPADVINGAVGSIVGPVFFNGSYRMSKIVAKKTMPDSVKASHILIAINEQKSEAQAKASIDSIEAMIKSGAPFDQVAAARSDDQGSAKKGGDLGYFAYGMMVPEFNEAAFDGKTGDLKVVKTKFGYHLLKITDQKDFKPAAQVAIFSKSLQPGTATTQAAFTKANDFVAKAKDAKSFEATAKAVGKDKRVAENITKIQTTIQGVGNAREISRWAFDNKIGTVSPVFNLDDKCVIALLDSRTEKGSLPSIESIRPQLENILKKEKKGKMIAEKYNGKTLDAIAAAATTTINNADTVMYLGGGNSAIGMEPKVIGASFNKANVNKVSTGIPGEQGVFYITVKNLQEGTISKEAINPMQARQMEMQISQQASQYIEYILKKKATIEDNRSNFF